MDNPECKIALQLGATGTQHAHSAFGCNASSGGEQRCLADPGRSLDDNQAARTGTSFGKRQLDTSELLTPLE
jgi:hypothetical protein